MSPGLKSNKKTVFEVLRKRITKKESFILSFNLDFINKSFKISDEREELEYEYSYKTMKGYFATSPLY